VKRKNGNRNLPEGETGKRSHEKMKLFLLTRRHLPSATYDESIAFVIAAHTYNQARVIAQEQSSGDECHEWVNPFPDIPDAKARTRQKVPFWTSPSKVRVRCIAHDTRYTTPCVVCHDFHSG